MNWRAFTLAEMTIAMIIASIVMGGALFTYQRLQQDGQLWLHHSEASADERNWVQQFESEFGAANAIRGDEFHIRLQLQDYEVEYVMDEFAVRMQHHRADTFHLSLHVEHIGRFNHSSLIDSISIILGDDRHLFTKRYAYYDIVHADTHRTY